MKSKASDNRKKRQPFSHDTVIAIFIGLALTASTLQGVECDDGKNFEGQPDSFYFWLRNKSQRTVMFNRSAC